MNHNNYYNYEEKKEDNYNKNNDVYPNLQIEGIINDLKMKGYNNFQIKDIISSIQKNHKIQKNRVSNYINNNQEHIVLNVKKEQETKLKGYESLINETEKKQRNEYNKYNTKIYISNNISENKNKIINDVNPKRKISETINNQINNQLFNPNNEQIMKRKKTNNQINDIFHNYGDIIKRRQKNELFNDSKNKFNNYSFYNSNNKTTLIKEINKGINDKNKIINCKGKKILKYTNKKHKKSDNSINHYRNNHEIINHININKNAPYFEPEIKQNITERNIHHPIDNNINFNDNKNTSREKIINKRPLINKHKSVRQFKDNLFFKNNKQNENSNNNNNKGPDKNKEGKKKIIFFKCRHPNNNSNDYNNYNYHDMSKDGSCNDINNNKKKYFLHHYDSNIFIKKENKKENSINKQKKTIDNSDNINLKEDIKQIKNIKFDKNIKLTKKKTSYNNISKKYIYDLNYRPKKVVPTHSQINSLNVEHNTISIAIEPSYQKNGDSKNNKKDKNILDNLKNNIKTDNNFEICKNADLKFRNNSVNKQIIKLKIENQNEINYNARKKKYKDGNYEGIIINGKRELRGVMNYKNGGKYEGQWRNDKRHGKGIFISQNYNNPKLIGIKYEGEFNNDKIEGYGIGKYSSGETYEGEWKNNKQYGRGILNYVDGGKYVGEWKEGQPNGDGIYYLKNGERFEGKFIDNKYNGYGKYYYNNGDYLEGIFKDDLPIGDCILHKNDGTTEDKHYDEQ